MNILRKILEFMIEIGNTIITAITIGNDTPQKIDVNTTQVWPDSSGNYINLPSTGSSITYGANYAYVSNITASTTAWTVESDSTSWLTVTKTSNTQARYDVTTNYGVERTGHLNFKISGVTYATYTVRQTASPNTYTFNITASTTTMTSGGGTLMVYVDSTCDGQPQELSYTITENGQTPTWIHFLQRQTRTGEAYNYVYYFAVNSNSGSPRFAGFTFTQDTTGTQKKFSLTQTP